MAKRVAHFLWGAWEIWGFISWIGSGVMSNALSFLLWPFAQELPLVLKVLYGTGLFIAAMVLSVAVIRLLQLAFVSQNGADGQSQKQTNSPGGQQISSTAGRDSYAAGRDVNVNPPPIAPPQAYQPEEILARAMDEAETNSRRTGISRIHVETEFLDMAWRHPNYSRWPQSLRDSMKAYRRQIGIARQWGQEHPPSYIGDYFDKHVIPTIEDFLREARAELSKLPHMD